MAIGRGPSLLGGNDGLLKLVLLLPEAEKTNVAKKHKNNKINE